MKSERVKRCSHTIRVSVVLLLAAAVMSAVISFAVPQKVYAYQTTLYKYSVKVKSGYLALRTGKKFDKKNEIGQLYTGDIVITCPTNGDESEYRYVYSPLLRKHGYVNGDYLSYEGVYEGEEMYARVETGYLALRNAKKFDKKNEIGKLNTGDPVIILDDNDSEYWTVYAPTLSKTGYVNRDYLVYNFRASSNHGKTLDFPYSSNAQWSETSDNRIKMRVQVINRSNTKTVSSFTLLYYAEDKDGVFVTDGYWLQEAIEYKRVDPGEIVYTDYFSFPQADKIKKAYVEIKEVGFTDGTTIEYNGDERPFATWTLK